MFNRFVVFATIAGVFGLAYMLLVAQHIVEHDYVPLLVIMLSTVSSWAAARADASWRLYRARGVINRLPRADLR